MKKLILASICLFTTLSLSANAQAPKGKRCEKEAPSKEQRIENQTKRLTKKLYLDSNEAAKFEATYKDYAVALDKAKVDRSACPKKGTDLTDAQKDALVSGRLSSMKAQAEVKEKYYKEFRKFLTPEQAAEVFKNGKTNDKKAAKGCDRSNGKKHCKSKGCPTKK